MLSLLITTREPACAQELDFVVLHESQLLEKLLQFADEAVRLNLFSHKDPCRDRHMHCVRDAKMF